MRTCDVLYIHPSKNEREPAYCTLPVGVIPILNRLQAEGLRVYGINWGMELSMDSTYSLEDNLAVMNYTFVLIDLQWYELIHGANLAALACKRVNPSCIIIVGGLTASLFAD